MSPSRDPFWQRVVDSHTPSPEAMRAAELDLQRQGPVPPLTPPQVQKLVHGALGHELAAPHVRAPIWRRVAAAAGILLAASLTAGWVASKYVWPEHQASPLTLDLPAAIEQAKEHVDTKVLGALVVLDNHFGGLLKVLKGLPPTPEVAAVADSVRDELRRQLAGAAPPPSAFDQESFDDLLATAGDATAPVEQRCRALSVAGSQAAAAIHAMRSARLVTLAAQQKQDRYLKRIQRDLGQ